MPVAFIKLIRCSFLAPVVDSVDPSTGPTVGGTTLTITGSNFGNGTEVTVKIGTSSCDDAEWVSGTEITCTSPAGIGKNFSVVVTVDDQKSGNSVTFDYDGMIFTFAI